MSYWEEAVSEAFDAEGVHATGEQIMAVAGWMKTAHECIGQSAFVETSPPSKHDREPERRAAWWEDTSKLSGSDWVLANQIQRMIASRFG